MIDDLIYISLVFGGNVAYVRQKTKIDEKTQFFSKNDVFFSIFIFADDRHLCSLFNFRF